MKKFYGTRAYVQSAGVHSDREIDGFTIAVCNEMGIDLARHRSRSFDDMQQWGDDMSSYDLVVALTPASQRQVLEMTRYYHLDVEYWPIIDPSGIGETRDEKLVAYRKARDQLIERLVSRFGPPMDEEETV